LRAQQGVFPEHLILLKVQHNLFQHYEALICHLVVIQLHDLLPVQHYLTEQ
jgi:hypothetical protein